MTNQSDIILPNATNDSQIYVLQTCYGGAQAVKEFTMLDMVLATIGVIISMVFLTGLCCLFMKISDLKLKRKIIKTAEEKGISVDVDKLDPKPYCSPENDTCTIIVPDVCVIAA